MSGFAADAPPAPKEPAAPCELRYRLINPAPVAGSGPPPPPSPEGGGGGQVQVGEGERPEIALLFLHDAAATSSCFDHLFELPTKDTDLFNKFPSYMLDLPGYNEAVGDKLLEAEALNGALMDFVENTVEAKKVVLVGHGLGGYVWILFAAAVAQKLDDIEMTPNPKLRAKAREGFLGGTAVSHVMVVDMDVAERRGPAGDWGEWPADDSFKTKEGGVAALKKGGFKEAEAERLVVAGAAPGGGGEWKSLVRPKSRDHYYKHFLSSATLGVDAIDSLGELEWGEAFTFLLGDNSAHASLCTTRPKLGGPGTICTKDSLEFIRHCMKGCDYLVLEGGHDLHRESVADFVAVLDSIVQVVKNGYDEEEEEEEEGGVEGAGEA
ncbi:hypothetical protein TeGR_g8164 [Tetraparma gracilis]|uniref:AB hydrolase-1 domain-containing protein n=1 Tax=Tetraparma gracilis TaxID=2962635 RepID=A0ABQ6NCH6_9STRA|nr:hypothetical protein TeGR_g8164 [Tetraparma gracilis]